MEPGLWFHHRWWIHVFLVDVVWSVNKCGWVGQRRILLGSWYRDGSMIKWNDIDWSVSNWTFVTVNNLIMLAICMTCLWFAWFFEGSDGGWACHLPKKKSSPHQRGGAGRSNKSATWRIHMLIFFLYSSFVFWWWQNLVGQMGYFFHGFGKVMVAGPSLCEILAGKLWAWKNLNRRCIKKRMEMHFLFKRKTVNLIDLFFVIGITVPQAFFTDGGRAPPWIATR